MRRPWLVLALLLLAFVSFSPPPALAHVGDCAKTAADGVSALMGGMSISISDPGYGIPILDVVPVTVTISFGDMEGTVSIRAVTVATSAWTSGVGLHQIFSTDGIPARSSSAFSYLLRAGVIDWPSPAANFALTDTRRMITAPLRL